MSGPPRIDTVEVRGIKLCRDPAREACFTVVYSLTEMHSANIKTPTARREFLHRDVNNEVQSLEIAAQTLVDFPDAPWELRVSLARQCWDEARHAALYYQRLREMGGYKGEFPVTNHEWGVACLIRSLPARLAIQNRAFEAGSLDVFQKMARLWRETGDERTAEITEAILSDEIQHVRFANQWLKRVIKDNPRALMEIAGAVNETNRITKALAPQEGEMSLDGVELAAARPKFPTNVADRVFAGFSDEEVQDLVSREERVRREEERLRRAEQMRRQERARADEHVADSVEPRSDVLKR